MTTLIERDGMTAIRPVMDGEEDSSQTIRELLNQRSGLLKALKRSQLAIRQLRVQGAPTDLWDEIEEENMNAIHNCEG